MKSIYSCCDKEKKGKVLWQEKNRWMNSTQTWEEKLTCTQEDLGGPESSGLTLHQLKHRLYAEIKSVAISVSTGWPHSLNVCSLAFEQRAWQTCCKIKVTSLHQLAARVFPVPSASCEIRCQKSVFTTRLRPQINVLLLKSTSDYFTLRWGTDGPWWEQDLLFWNLTLSFHVFWIPSCCHDNAALDPLHPTFPSSSSSSSSMSDFHVSKYNRQTGWRREGETRRCERFVNRCRVRVNVQVSWWMITP